MSTCLLRFAISWTAAFLSRRETAGTDDKTVNELADYAEKEGVGNGSHVVPLQLVAETARRMVKSARGNSRTCWFVSTSRAFSYIDEVPVGCNKATAGGGALLNPGFHGFDLCR
jgi:hypothetical protein